MAIFPEGHRPPKENIFVASALDVKTSARIVGSFNVRSNGEVVFYGAELEGGLSEGSIIFGGGIFCL